MIWSFIQVVGKQGVTLLVFAALAMLLNPADFGVLGMAMAWIAFVGVFLEIGFGAALIQRKQVDKGHFSTIFFINIGTGVLLTAAGVLLSWPCAAFFKTPEVQPVMAVLSLGFLLNALSLTQLAIAQRQMDFKKLAFRDIAASLTGGATGLIMAFFGFGVWSLVAQSLVTGGAGALLLWGLSQWRPVGKDFSLRCAKELLPYSSKIFLFNVLKYFVSNTDKVIIGYLFGSTILGLYTFAYHIVVSTTDTVCGAIANYLFPKFSRIQDNVESIKTLYLFINKAIGSVVAPFSLIAVFFAPILTPLVFGQKWTPAVPFIQILTVVAVTHSLSSALGQVMKSVNRPGLLFYWAAFFAFTTVIFIWFGSRYGITGAVAGMAAAQLFALPLSFAVSRSLMRVNLKETAKMLLPYAISALSIGAPFTALFFFGLMGADFRAVLALLFVISFYLFAFRLIDRPFMAEILRMGKA